MTKRKVTVMMTKEYVYLTENAVTKETVMENLIDAIEFGTIEDHFVFTVEGTENE